MLKQRNNCRVCGSTDLLKFMDFGKMPLAGGYLKKEDFVNERSYPLKVYFCNICTLVQILDVVSADTLFRDYRYSSSVSLANHFKNYAKEVSEKLDLKRGSFIVEIGSNDGVLLEPFTDLGMKTLGVDPAINISNIAKSKGLEVMNDYFTEDVVKQIISSEGNADLVCANNVFAHIDDIPEVLKGVKTLLNKEGAFVFEVHYAVDLVKENQYDTIYHEHLCYYSIKSLVYLLNLFGMEIFDIKRIPIHSGSVRVYARNKGQGADSVSSSIAQLLRLEERMGLNDPKTYLSFAENAIKHKDELVVLLKSIKNAKKNIICYGAPGRGNTLLNYCKIGPDMIDYVTDDSPERYNRYIPGMHLPILPTEAMKKCYPDYALLLAWSYAEQVFKKEEEYIKNGGKFIIPISLKIYDKTNIRYI